MSVRILIGDVRDKLAEIADESVHCVVTSPPYYRLRDYGVAGQLGLESTPDEYIAKMVAVFREVRRVLRADGTLWLNIGDSYAAQGGAGAGGNAARMGRAYQQRNVRPNGQYEGIKSKDLIGIPWMLAFALRADGWWLRQDIIWSKPNPMPESVTDRCTKAHEYLFLLSKSERYFYDADAIKQDSITGDLRRPYTSEGAWQMDGRPADQRHGGEPRDLGRKGQETPAAVRSSAGSRMGRGAGWRDDPANAPLSRNRRSVWTIATAPYPEAHFATFPPALVEPCILAGCAKGGAVLDPFGGAGTTGLVADRLGRDAILIEIKPEYAAMARRRIDDDRGPLFVEAAD